MPVPEEIILKRRSQVWPAPTLEGTMNLPTTWEFTSETVEDLGHIKVEINGVDVTTYRDVPTVVESWSVSEPFGPETATISFPQINPFEPLPAWLGSSDFTSYDDVVLTLVDELGAQIDVLWTGFIISHSDEVSGGFGVTVECLGSLYELDLYLAKPPASVPAGSRDVSTAIEEHFSTDTHPSLRLGPLQAYPPTSPPDAPNPVPLTGILTNKEGSWEPVLTGYIQELLSMATFYDGVTGDANQWTLDYQDGHPVFAPKDMTTVSWTVRCGQPGVKHSLEVDRSMAFNTYYGEGIATDNCRWRNLQFRDQLTATDPFHDESFFYPVAWSGWVEPVIPDPAGDDWIVNPTYDADRLRIERHEHHGANIDRITVDDYVHTTGLERTQFPPLMGNITLEADPQEGHRFQIHSGQNILLQGYRGEDILFHINQVEVDTANGTVDLAVDTMGRDYLTWSEVKNRNKDNEHPSWKQERRNRNSKTVEDRYPEWDCEAGSGIIPLQAVTMGAWHVYRINAAAGGTVVQTNIDMDTPCRYGLGIFDSDPTGTLSGSPLVDPGKDAEGNPLESDYWDAYGDSLVIAWGQFEQAAGYYPGKESNEDAMTGDFVDDASWYYESQDPPYLWLAIYVEGSGTVNMSGQLKQGVY